MKIYSFFLTLVFSISLQATVLSPSSEEMKVSFSAEFKTSQNETTHDLIESHYQHLFGYFQSPTMVRQYGINGSIGGMAALKIPLDVSDISEHTTSDGRVISYKVTGMMLVNKLAAVSLLKSGKLQVTMPYELDNYYDKKCTDDHYNTRGDFWYFFDPFRRGCEYLKNAPLAKDVELELAPSVDQMKDADAYLQTLRGDNGNGDLFEIYSINGYAENAKAKADEGRVSFEKINKWLRDMGFQEKILARYQNRPIYEFEKDVNDKSGKTIKIRFTRLLAETSINKPNVTFAKFFKKAVEQADVLIYSGHSGLGGNLDIASLEEKAGVFHFNPDKRQIFFFDGCSSYSYYLTPFETKKGSSNLDVMTNGLESLFATEFAQHSQFLKILFDVDQNPSWMQILEAMETPLRGRTYMLSVGMH